MSTVEAYAHAESPDRAKSIQRAAEAEAGSADDDRGKAEEGKSDPLLWGFLTTLFLGVVGYFALLISRNLWPLLWLPLLSPVLGIIYFIFSAHSTRGMNRFLAGFGICLVVIMAVGVLLIIAIAEGVIIL